MGSLLYSSPGLGLFANQDFSPQEIIGEYRGVSDVEQTQSPYAFMGHIEAEKYRNECAQINDGFPNIAFLLIPKVGELTGRANLVTIDSIKMSEQFCLNYGFIPVKIGPYCELRGREMREFIKEYTIDSLLKCFLIWASTREMEFEDYIKAQQFRYILETPVALFSMILDENLSEKQARKLFGISLTTIKGLTIAPQVNKWINDNSHFLKDVEDEEFLNLVWNKLVDKMEALLRGVT